MEALAKAAEALAEAAKTVAKPVTETKKTTAPWGWIQIMTVVVLAIVANTLITIYLYPTKRPDYWWLPGAWIWFQVRDRIWIPLKEYIWPETIKDPNKRRRMYSPPRIA